MTPKDKCKWLAENFPAELEKMKSMSAEELALFDFSGRDAKGIIPKEKKGIEHFTAQTEGMTRYFEKVKKELQNL